MRVLRLDDSAGAPKLVETEAPQPAPGTGEVLIRVVAAGVTPTELLWYPTSHTKAGEKRVGAVPGHEFSGVIAGVGRDVGGVTIGQDVFGMNDWFADGATADYCLAPFSSIALKPTSLTHIEAASIPIGGLTAWQGLFARAKLQAGERVLVHGGAGAVGVFAVQLGKFRGAHVVATASARNLDFVANLGAEKVIDYQTSRFEENAQDVDVVFDTIGGETLQRSWRILKPNGRMVTVAADEEGAREGRDKEAFFIVEPSQTQLAEIADLLESGSLRPVVDSVVPLSEASRAYTGQIERRRRGKVVIAVAS